MDKPALPEPAAHMYPSDLERFAETETFAHAFSVAVGNPDERSEPLVKLSDAIAHGDAMAAWGAAQERESKDAQRGRSARMRAAGMASLLSEAIGAGALRFHFDDLKERMEMAIADQERAAQGD